MTALGWGESGQATVEVHCFERHGEWLALDVQRHQVHEISELQGRILAEPHDFFGLPPEEKEHGGAPDPSADLASALRELEALKLIGSSNGRPPRSAEQHLLDICGLELNVAQDCNLRCEYCKVKQGSFGSTRALMPPSVTEAAVDFLLDVASHAETLYFWFLGGEPLLNFDAIRHLVSYVETKSLPDTQDIVYWLSVNGTLLEPEVISYFSEHGIRVQVSLDGDQAAHDSLRKYTDGRGSYADAVRLLPALVAECQGTVTLRATVAPQAGNLVDAYRSLKKWGAGTVAVRHVMGFDPGFIPNESTTNQLIRQYSELADLYLNEALEDGVFPQEFFRRHILSLFTGKKRLQGCGAGVHMLGVSADGTLYPCKDLAEMKQWALGDLWKGVDEGKLGSWHELVGNVDRRPVCRDCWARYLCGGGCASLDVKTKDGITALDAETCRLERHFIELSVWLFARLRRLCPGIFLKLVTVGGLTSSDPSNEHSRVRGAERCASSDML